MLSRSSAGFPQSSMAPTHRQEGSGCKRTVPLQRQSSVEFMPKLFRTSQVSQAETSMASRRTLTRVSKFEEEKTVRRQQMQRETVKTAVPLQKWMEVDEDSQVSDMKRHPNKLRRAKVRQD
eukprot:6583812-Karenia_brevis.AAC.1